MAEATRCPDAKVEIGPEAGVKKSGPAGAGFRCGNQG